MKKEYSHLSRGVRVFHLILLTFLLLPGILEAQHNRRNAKDKNPYRASYQRLAQGQEHTLEIRNGELWAWGNNVHGQLGDGTNTTRTSPVRIGSASNWVSVITKGYFNLGIRSDGTLWAWGLNGSGQLGDGTTTSRNVPTQVGSATDWVAIATGLESSFGIRSNGTLWAWGYNSEGQLGDGSNTQRNTPVQVGSSTNWVSIVSGSWHTVGLQANGTLWTWGWNTVGQLGLGTTSNHNTPQQVGTSTDWKKVSSGYSHNIAVRADGTLWAWGNNGFGQLGDGTTTNRTSPIQIGSDNNWVEVAASHANSLGITADGKLIGWGNNGAGQLGDGTTTQRNSPVQIGTDTTWVNIFAGAGNSFGRKANGTQWAWGQNNFGQLGDGTTIQRLSPVQMLNTNLHWMSVSTGAQHTVALRSDGTLWSWGFNAVGQLGDGTTTDRTSAVQIGSSSDWVSVSAGGGHSMGIRSNGTLWAWGFNFDGRLGLGDNTNRNTPVQVGTANNWVSVSAGENHTMAIRSDGTLWGWGYNDYGQLGDGSTTTRTSPVQIGSSTNWVSVAAGIYHTMAVRSDGTLWGWGLNTNGQYGNGSTTTEASPVQIGSSTNWVAVEVGAEHSIALRSDGTLWASGLNHLGQLGDGTTTTRLSLVQVGNSTNWVSLSSAGHSNLGVQSDGTLWVWGNSDYGQLGYGSTIALNNPIQNGSATNWVRCSAAGSYSAVFNSTRDIICLSGGNFHGQLGDGTFNASLTFGCNVSSIQQPPLSVSITSNTPVCSGSTLNLTADDIPGATYSWAGPNGYTANTRIINLSNATTTMAGIYTVTATLNSSTATASHTVTVNATPSVSISPSGTVAYCQSGSVTLTASGASTYLWSNSSTGSTISVSSPGTYSVSSTENGCTGTSAIVTVTQTSPVTNNQIGNSQTICFGENPATLTGTSPAGGTGSFTYQWESSSDNSTWGTVTGATNASFATGRFIFHSYYRRVINSGGCTNTSGSVSITVNSCSPAITAGSAYTRILCMDSTSWAWGTNFQGLIGGGNNNNNVNPALTINLTDIVAVSAGSSCSYFLRKDGTVWATGDGRYGGMGNGTTTAINNTPVQVSGLTNIVAIEGGNGGAAYALKADGTVWGWGLNNQGQMGDGIPTQPDQLTPIRIPNLTNAIKIVAGANHVLALRADSTVWGWGRNDFGQAGTGSQHRPAAAISGLTSIKQIGAGDLFSIALKNDGTVVTWGLTSANVSGLSNITDISLRNISATPLALRNDGVLFAWGKNSNGEVGNGTISPSVNTPVQVSGLSNVIQIATGQAHNVALLATGELYAWGNNGGGCLGNLTTTSSSLPVHVFSRPCFIIQGIGSNTISAAQTVCSNVSPVTLTGTSPVGCGGVYTYQWQSSNNNISWSNISGATLSSHSPGMMSSSAYFRRVVTGGTCFPHPSQAVLITVHTVIGNNSIGTSQTICHSNTPTAITGSTPSGGSGSYAFTWLSSSDNNTWNNFSGATGQGYTPGSLTSGLFLKRIVNSGACAADTSTFTGITVLPPIGSNTLSSNQSLCAGITPSAFAGSAPSGGTGSYAYQWESSSNQSSWSSVNGATTQNFTAPQITSNIYYRRLVTSGTCATSTSAAVSIQLLPNIGDNTIMADQTICSATFPMPITGSLPSGGIGHYNYSWQTSANNSTWGIHHGVAPDLLPGMTTSTTYFRRVVSSSFCTSNTSAPVLVTRLVGSNVVASAQTIPYFSAPIALTATDNLDSPGMVWEMSHNNYDWSVLPGANQPSFQPPVLIQHMWYRRKIASVGCTDTVTSAPVRITLQMVNDTALTATSNSPVCSGSPLYLNATGPANATYLWYGPNGYTSNQQNPSFNLATENLSGVYRVRCTKVNGDTASVTVNVEVGPSLGNFQVLFNNPVCEGSTLVLSSSYLPRLTYNWSGPGGFTSDQAVNSFPASTTSLSGVYTVQVTSPGCTSITRTLSVTVNAALNPSPTSNGPVCQGGILNFNSSSRLGATYAWAGPNGFTSTLSNPSIANVQTVNSGVYTLSMSGLGCTSVTQTHSVLVNASIGSLSVSSNSPVCLGNTLTLSIPSYVNATYTWLGPNGFSGTNSNIMQRTNVVTNMAGVYTLVAVVPGCGTATRTSTVSVLPSLSATMGSNSPICVGNSLQLTTTALPGASYLWTGPLGFSSALQNPSISSAQNNRSGEYTLTLIQAGCGTISYTTSVQVNVNPVSAIASGNGPLCTGASLSASVTSIGNASYIWSGPSGFTGTGNTISRSPLTLAHQGNYNVNIAVPGCGSTVKSYKLVVVDNNISATSNSPVCTGSVIYLNATAGAGSSYSWSGPNGFASLVPNPTISNAGSPHDGNYTLTTTNLCGTFTNVVSVTVVARPSLATVSVAQTVCTPAPLTLTGSTVSGATHQWAGPGGFTASGTTFTKAVTVLQDGGVYTYTVSTPSCGSAVRTVMVTTANGSQVSASVYPNPQCVGGPIYLQSVFIPGATYNWSGPAGFNVNAQNTSRSQTTTLMSGTYTYTANVPGCGPIVQTINVTVNPCREGQESTEGTPVAEIAGQDAFTVSLFPNPTQGMTQLVITGVDADSETRVTVTDMLGHTVLMPGRQTVAGGTHTWELDFRQMAKGIYFVKISGTHPDRIERVVVN